MTRTALLLCLGIGLFAPDAPSFAQAADPLPLERALTEALQANPSLQAARAGADASASGVDAVRAAWYPRISFVEGWQRGNQPIFVFSSLLASRRFAASNFAIDQLNHPDPLGYFHATTSIEQLVIDGGARRAAVDQALASKQGAEQGVREAAHALAAGVTEAYGRVLAIQAERKAAAAALDAGREDLARARRRRDAGLATEADVLALAVHVADMEQRVVQADGDTVIARAHVNRLTGAPIDRVFEAVEPAGMVEASLPALTALLAEAEQNRPDLARAEAATRGADSARRAARSAFLPRVAAQAAFDVSGTRFTDRASSWLVGGEVRWSLALAGAEKAQLTAATAAVTRARAEREDLRAQVQVDVVSAVQRLQTARARQAVGRATVEQARESQRIVRDRYDAGLAPVNDLLRAATAVLDAEARRTAAFVDALTARAQLDRALGRQP
ncbi:MAG: TolC family protein [Vicinamibacterales bacterium]